LAGVSAREAALRAGLHYSHLIGVEAGREPLLDTDCRDLGAALDVPADWLRSGWGDHLRRA